ncbi:MAG: tripartite tricarboxylate transporter substrate-binding protein [Beijerinckiaceae bacterium]|nr:tripartite tricarboxylate transporter substrate-binding protein [Beijerinckiaceae bacterium]
MNRVFASLVALACLAPLPALAQGVADFYRGKSIRLIVGAASGGGYDIPARLLATHMPKHIPGNPSIVVENMPGATSLIMTNYLYARAPRDGTALGMPNNNVPMEPRLKLLSREGGNVSFDIGKFGWVGSPVQEPQILFTLTSAAGSFGDLKTRKVVLGSTGRSADNFSLPFMLNQLLGAKTDIVPGYKGQSDIFIAIDRGEVQGNSTGLTNLLVTKPDWVRDDRVRILVQFGATRAREIPDVPTAVELASDEATRDLFRFFSMKFLMARPIALPPDVPPERVKALQDAFDATMKDEAFLVDARKIGLEINPVSGAEVAKLVADIQDVPESVVQRLRDVLSGAQAR